MRLWRFFALMLVGVLTPIFVYPIRDTLIDWNRQSGAQAYLAEQAAPATVALIAQVRSELAKTPVQTILVNGEPVAVTAEGVPAVEDLSLRVDGCTYNAEEVEAILQEYGSPAANQDIGTFSVEQCKATGIDNAYWLWMFVYESGAGTAPGWSGRKPDGTTTANTGNIICAGYSSCYGRFRDFQGDWKEGTRQHFKLLACYRDGGGEGCEGLWNGRSHATIEEALNTWAPPSDGNNTSEYTAFVIEQTQAARRIKQGEFVAEGGQGPSEIRAGVQDEKDSYTAPPLALTGCLGTNVRAAHNSSPGLHHVVIPPGHDWSFNETWKIDYEAGVDCGVFYGGVCNQASRYSNVARNLGLQVENVYHGLIYDSAVPAEDNLSIWSSGVRGGQDLILTNTTGRTAHIVATIEGDTYIVKGWLE